MTFKNKTLCVGAIIIFLLLPTVGVAGNRVCSNIFSPADDKDSSFTNLIYLSEKPLAAEESIQAFQSLRNVLPKGLVRFEPVNNKDVGPFLLYFSNGKQIGISYNRYAGEPRIIAFGPEDIRFIRINKKNRAENVHLQIFFPILVGNQITLARFTFLDFDKDIEPHLFEISYLPGESDAFFVLGSNN